MSWLKRLTKSGDLTRSTSVDVKPANVCFEAFKSHWQQICDVINGTSRSAQTGTNFVVQIENTTLDDVETTRNLLEQMIFLLVEEQSSGDLCGPIFEFTLNQNIFQKLNDWWEQSTTLKEKMMINLLKVYEVLISQAQHSLLHHNQLVNPMLKLLSSSFSPRSEEMDGHIVVLLNLLCVWINRDQSLLQVFFIADKHGPASFQIFSLLIEFIHRNGSVGQQARDALLLCMALSNENPDVAKFMVHYSNFCPVLATGLSALYSTLPCHMKVRDEDWHCLVKEDWSHVPELTNFLNSFQFCNSIVEVADVTVGKQLLNFLYNGFLVSVVGPSLHKTSAEEVVVTTAYLNLFLQSITAPSLMRCFLSFLLTHRHENSLIINTLIQRIASNNRLAVVSLSLIKTLIDLNCEDFLLQLVLRYLIPCQHILVSQRHAVCDVDMYNASASRFLALVPTACESKKNLQNSFENTGYQYADNDQEPYMSEVSEDRLEFSDIFDQSQKEKKSFNGNADGGLSHTITNINTMAEFGPELKSQWDLNTSYMDYLENARLGIERCTNACAEWSTLYDGKEINEATITTKSLDQAHNLNFLSTTHSQPLNSKTSTMYSDVIADDFNNDPTQKALSATYKTMSITTLALGGENSTFNNLNNAKTRSQTFPQVNTNSLQVHSEKEFDDLNNNGHNKDHCKTENLNKNISTESDNVSKKHPRSSENLSVDEFFRSLMEIVPKSTRDLLEEKSGRMSTFSEDTGSLETTSDVELLVSPVHTLNSNEEVNSVNSPLFIKKDNHIKMDDEEYHFSDEDPENKVDEQLKILVEEWRSENFTDNTDIDSESNQSSSFYENQEYTPTHISVAPSIPLKLQGIPYTGPLIGTLFAKLDQMVNNSLYENLLVTGIITRLAIFPQPLLRSFLLNTQMIFQPSVRSLYQVLNSARNKINAYSEKVDNFSVLVSRAQKYFMVRADIPSYGDIRSTHNLVKTNQLVDSKVPSRTLISEMFLRRKQNKKKTSLHKDLETLLKMARNERRPEIKNSNSMFYVKPGIQQHKINEELRLQELKTKNAVYACIILSEFVKEIAAIAQEHAVLHLL